MASTIQNQISSLTSTVSPKLTRDELAPFLAKSNLQGVWMLFFNWALIILSFVFVAWWPHLVSILLAVLIIGGRQLGLGVLMHDCAHNALFKSDRLNRWVGQWLCAAPLLANRASYWKIHAQHHRLIGTPQDPDLSNYQAYPITSQSLRRKVFRDLSGQTGIKILLGTFGQGRDLFSLGKKKSTQEETNPTDITLAKHLTAPLLVNGVLLALLWLSGHPGLYLLWVVAYLSAYMLFARLRQIAEHGAVPDLTSTNPLLNTRTTVARWWERLTIAPNHVHYHLEHHLYPTVPPYRLAVLHDYLKSQSNYAKVAFPHGYRQVLKLAIVS